MKKVHAFTVLVMIVAMAISAITISAAFALYQMIFVQWTRYRTTTNEVYEAVTMERLMKEDAAASSYVYATHAGMRCVGEDKNVAYIFQDSIVIRNGGRLDTFHVGACSRTMFFNNKPVADSALADVLHFTFVSVKEDSNYIHIIKNYAADELFRLDH